MFTYGMKAISFPDWQDVLECDGELSEANRDAYLITIRWFLSFCRKAHRPATKEQAYAFMEEACERKQPSDWVIARWKEAINWFFRHAPKEEVGEMRDAGHEMRDADQDDAKRPPPPPAQGGVAKEKAEPELGVPRESRGRGPNAQPARLARVESEWRLKTVKGMRIRQLSYHTEKAYLNWLERFARYWKTRDLEALGENEINLFLDHLAVKEKISGGTQRGPERAGVFLPRCAQT